MMNRSVALKNQTGCGAAWRHVAASFLVAAAAGAACDKMPLMAPSESTITLYASTSSVPVNGSVEITATVIESAGTPVQNGTVVTFYASLGTVDPTEARTQNGKATVRFFAGTQSGTASVRASSGGSSTKDALSIAIGGAAAGRVEVSASPSQLPSSGGTVTLVATVYDGSGNRLPSVQVSFAADNGSVSPSTAVTDASGEARATLSATIATKVTVTVAGSSDNTVTSSIDIKLRSAPDVTLSVTTTSPVAGQAVSFTATVKAGTSGAAVRAATLDFGDGTSQSIGLNGTTTVSHTYQNAGTYTVTASATDSAGETSTSTASVVVKTLGPVSVTLSVSPTTATVNQPVTMTATATAPSGTTIERYEWNFGDGGTRVTSGGSTTYVYGHAGRYMVSVKAVTAEGPSGSAQADVMISGIVVSLTASTLTPSIGTSVTFTATVTPTGLTIDRYEWTFGDGTTRTTSTNTTAKSYTSSGSKTVIVRAVTPDGASASSTIVIEVTGFTVVVTADTTSPSVGTEVTFTATVSPGTVTAARYEWDFGDGTTRTTADKTAKYTYSSARNRTVTVRAVTAEGASGTGSMTITVSALSVSLSWELTGVRTYKFTAVVSPSNVTVSRYEWSFGDNTGTKTTTTNSTDKTYTAAGSYTVTVTIFTTSGASASTSVTINVL